MLIVLGENTPFSERLIILTGSPLDRFSKSRKSALKTTPMEVRKYQPSVEGTMERTDPPSQRIVASSLP